MNELYFLGMDIVEETNTLVNTTTMTCTNGMTENELRAYTMGIKNTISALAGILDDSDLPVVSKAADTLKQFGVPYELHIYSAHRTPVEAKEFSENARANGFGVIIAAAGMAAHLAGAIAANTTLPVIGIPMKSKYLDGIDALLSTVQMPSGIPVATVAIDGAVNAALLSIEILAVTDEDLAKKLKDKRDADTKTVLEKNAAAEKQFNI